MDKEAILNKIRSEKVVAIIRGNSADGVLDCAKALADGGLTSIELTHRLLGYPNVIPNLRTSGVMRMGHDRRGT
jgi:2-keto-3-deoxy-6-phosphogluconate aldolase